MEWGVSEFQNLLLDLERARSVADPYEASSDPFIRDTLWIPMKDAHRKPGENKRGYGQRVRKAVRAFLNSLPDRRHDHDKKQKPTPKRESNAIRNSRWLILYQCYGLSYLDIAKKEEGVVDVGSLSAYKQRVFHATKGRIAKAIVAQADRLGITLRSAKGGK